MSYILLSSQKEGDYNICCCSYLCCTIFKWILSLLIWASIISLIIISKTTKTDTLIPMIIMSFSYCLYFISEFFSPTLRLICSKSKRAFNPVISDFKEAKPNIIFTCVEQMYNARKITTQNFPFIFYRDMSEDIILDKEEIKGKHYIKLKINREIFSDNNETLLAFNQRKLQFFKEMTSGSTWVDISFPGLQNTYLISIRNEENCCLFLNSLVYIIFVLLSLGEIYELILKSIIFEKTITIKKLITIRKSIVIHIVNENENKSQIPSDAGQNNNKGKTEIVVHNDENRLNIKDNNLKNNQIGNQSNRNSERENILTNEQLKTVN